MHERSLVLALIRQTEQVVAENGGGCVSEIRVQVGPLSGVEPLLLQSAFTQCKPEIWNDRVQLVIEEVLLTAECRQCAHSFVIDDFHFRCPLCESDSVRVTQGDQFQLVSVTIDQIDPVPKVAL